MPPHLLAVVPPPPYARRLCSDDPDEVYGWISKRDGHHSRVIHGHGRYGFQLAMLESQAVAFGWAKTTLGQTCIHIPLVGPQHYAFGRQRISAAPGSLVFIAPGSETSRRSGASSVFAMDVATDALVAELRARRVDDTCPWPEFPQALRISERLQLGLADAIAELVKSLDVHVPAARRMHAESRAIAALAEALLVQAATGGRGRLSVQRVADLEAWIDAHLGDSITMGRLCEVAQVSERSLQQAFKARRGMSPMRFVCERRLAVTQQRLSTASVEDDITTIATTLGFTHLGRFATAYREVFGEAPSQTLLRGRKATARTPAIRRQ